MITQDLGIATAYGYAKSKGYTGTEVEFAELMASYADVGQTAVDAKDAAVAAKTAAQTAATTATNKASEATTAATTATTKAGEASTSASTATSAKDDAVSAKTAAQTAQTGAETAAASVAGSAAQIATNAEDITQLKSEFTATLDTEIIYPVNKIDETKLTTGRILWNGTMDTNTGYKTTDYIPVNNGDVLRFYKGYFDSSAEIYLCERTTGERLALYDANKTYLGVSGQYPFNLNNGYTVDNADAKFIRASYDAAFSPVELAINLPVQGAQPLLPYFEPYLTSKRLDSIEDAIDTNPNKIIDCWGDSRTEMNIDTSYTDYLATLLGNPYIVSNHGLSGQSIGQVAFRYGSNEVYVTLANNQIPASGSVNITNIICSKGSRTGNNMETADATRGSRCSINGVSGMLVYQRNGTKAFVRDAEGPVVNVYPSTKAIPTPYFDETHMQIMWAGKNDFSYAWPDIVSGIESNYDAMVSALKHDKYIILGETYSNEDNYAEGSTNREYVDSINAYLAEKYPNNFINVQSELVENGLTLESITPTEQDQTDISGGFIPTSLMADATHPNQYGREAIAKIIYAWMQTNNWI